MPSNMLYLDTNFPSFTGEESTGEKISTIQNYMFMLVEQLRYSLRNLDKRNFNEAGLKEITDPIYARIESAEGEITQLQVTAQGLALRVSDAENNITQLQVTAKGLALRVSDAEGNIAQLQVTAQGLQSQVSDARGDITLLQQTVESVTISARNGESSSILTLSAKGISAKSVTIAFTGMVTFRDLQGSGSTVINGDNITTGTILCSRIRLGGKMEVYLTPTGRIAGGYLGYMTGMTAAGTMTGGMGFADATERAVMICTNAGARMGYDGESMVVCTGKQVNVVGSRIYLTGEVYVNGKPLDGGGQQGGIVVT